MSLHHDYRLSVVYRPLGELKPYKNNPRTHNKR